MMHQILIPQPSVAVTQCACFTFVFWKRSCECMCTCLYVCSCVPNHTRPITHTHVKHSHGQGMRSLRLVGSLKLDVSFAGYRLFYGALLQKRPIILRSLLISVRYGVATISRLLQIVVFFCRISSLI